MNVNIMDTERTKKNLENIKSHAGYQAYDQEEVDELTGYIIIEISFFCGLIAFCFFLPNIFKKIVFVTCTFFNDLYHTSGQFLIDDTIGTTKGGIYLSALLWESITIV